MTFDEYLADVERGEYPFNPRVELPSAPFVNGAGCIQNLVIGNFTTATLIESNAGADRSHHYHKTDWHFMYVLAGKMTYYWRPVGGKGLANMCPVGKGEMVFTPPMVEHSTFFPEATTLLTFSRNRRDHQSHESDLVRVEALWKI